MEDFLVSIIVPCYNHQEFVIDCLKSIIDQTYHNIEVLILDDCSKDDSYQLIQSYRDRLEKRFKKVYINRNERNQGLIKNLNFLIQMSQGKYVKLLASDDLMLPDHIEKMVDFAKENPDVDIYYSNAYYISADDKYDQVKLEEGRKKLRIFHHEEPPAGKNLTDDFCKKSTICATTVLIPRKTYDNFGLYEEKYTFEDWPFWLKVSVNGSFAYNDISTVCYRELANSFSHFTGKKSYERQLKFYKEKVDLISRYKKYCSFESWTFFFNNEFAFAAVCNNIDLAKTIWQDCNQYGVRVNFLNKMKYFLLKIKIYPVIIRVYESFFLK